MWAFLPLVSLLGVTSVGDVANPRPRAAWVSDGAGVIDDAAEQRMNALLDSLHRRLSVEIAVVTVDDVAGTPKDFAGALFQRWKIGAAAANNGLLVLLVVGQRRLEMETGYGLEPLLPDGWLGVMQNEAMVPRFASGDYAGGLQAGLQHIAAKLQLSPEEARQGVAVPVADLVGGEADAPSPSRLPLVPIAIGIGAVLAIGGALYLRHRHQRTCPKCRTAMAALDEVADDEHLTAGQRTEESIGSVRHDIFHCASCGFLRHLPRRAWFSGYRRCPSCEHRTAGVRGRRVILAPTYDAPGIRRIDLLCVHCSHAYQIEEHIPQRQRPSTPSSSSGFSGSSSGSSSSSSAGGFGGGRSGGGGAGSSW